YLVQVDSLGSKVWEHVYYITENDAAYRLTRCGDGGYAVIGNSSQSVTMRDVWLLRTDSLGDTLWTRLYGGQYNDAAAEIVGAADGGFAFAGYTYSFSGQPGTTRDGWLVRLAANGDTLWTRTFSGVYGEGGIFSSVSMLPDHGFLLSGTDDAHQGEGWVVQTDSLGNLVWQSAWGNITKDNWDHIVRAQPTDDGGCIAFGSSYTYSTPSFDAWMLKVDSLCVTGTEETPSANHQTPNSATIVRGCLYLPASAFTLHSSLFSLSGQKVLDLRPGPNDVSHLAPGVYFVRSTSRVNRSAPDGTKLVVQR
ncbi:hypothetical protein JXD38_08185, partial [candidate division WOR-3 bacterium]|nr:hypothetical protein [candidate division WOR-3 bacterium]